MYSGNINSNSYIENLNRKLNSKFGNNIGLDFNSYITEEKNMLKKSLQSNYTGGSLMNSTELFK